MQMCRLILASIVFICNKDLFSYLFIFFSEIFIRYCFFLKETGYKEKALTSIQALLEFNIFCPSSLKSASRETKMAAFEEFWESGCGKLGFPGGQGWKHLVQHKEQSNQQSTPSTGKSF